MGAPPDAFAGLAERLTRAWDRLTCARDRPTRARERDIIDGLLDQWFDYQCRASDWDAEFWGFDPDRWCETERAQMARQHGCGPRPRWPWARPSHT